MRQPVFSWALFPVALLALSGCQSQSSAPPPGAPPAPPVAVSHPLQRQIVDHDEFTGRVAAIDSVVIRSRVSGFLTKVNFVDGQEVNKGDLLFEVDPRPYQAEVDRTSAELQKAQSQAELAEKDFNRATALYQSTAISTEEYDTRRQAWDQNVAAVKSAQAALETAQLNLNYSKITAPISGKLGRRMITEGNLVTADTTDLTTLVSLDPIYSYVNVDEPTILKYQQLIRDGKRKNIAGGGIPCALGIGNGNTFNKLGHLDFVDNQFDSTTGTLVCRGVFENHDRYLIPGQFVRVRVDGSEAYPAMLVPEQAVQKDQDKRSVLVVGSDNMLQPRVVTVGNSIGNLCVITSGLTSADWVVLDTGILHPGMAVKPDEQTIQANDSTLSEAAPIPESPTTVIR